MEGKSAFMTLPNELFLDVASHLKSFRDLNSLVRTSRFFHAMFNRHLYDRAVAADDFVLDFIMGWVLSRFRLASLTLLLDNGLSVNYAGRFITHRERNVFRRPMFKETMLGFLCTHYDGERAVPLAQLLIQRGIDTKSNNLYTAIGFGNCPIAALFLTHGADVNTAEGRNVPPLHYACQIHHRGKNTEMIRFLIAHGADIEARSTNDDTPLMMASEHNSHFMAVLLEHGADAGIRNKHGETPLHHASRWFKSQHHDVAESLLEHGAMVNATDEAGRTPLHWILESHFGDPLFMVEFLLENGADANAISKEGLSPLHYALRFNAPDVVALLLKYGAMVNTADPLGRTPLHWLLGIYSGDPSDMLSIAENLLEKGADVNAISNEGLSPLKCALSGEGREEIVALLLEHGADVSVLSRRERRLLAQMDV
jgi:ankyrin repeat protein